MNNKKLYRSRKDKIVAGVLGGLAEYLQVDSIFVRIIYLLLLFFGNFAFFTVLYIIGWIIIPEQPKVSASVDGTSVEGFMGSSESNVDRRHTNAGVILGAILLVIGSVILFKNLSGYIVIHVPTWLMPYFDLVRASAIPVLLIIVGIVLILNHRNNHTSEGEDK
ncbi:PspC domain-containing protein [Coprothermobacter platensis]|uniref:PspC domain-containing protein n=1 Tax=Coprothermobacter platensis TaxID=108819 RepID=UPI000366B6FC|nr:PspC domain-containing protein [Coprothermobacter platensis]